MNYKTTRPFNPGGNRGLNIESILTAPLVAASTANSMMLKEQTQFLMDFCFSKNGDVYDPVMIEMSLTNSVIEPGQTRNDDAKITRIQTTFHLPLITIIPINSLAVDNVSIEFDMEITSQYETNADESNNLSKSQGDTSSKVQLMGKVSYDSKESNSSQSKYQNSSRLKVNINAGQLPLPVGLTSLLDLYMKSVMPAPKKTE